MHHQFSDRIVMQYESQNMQNQKRQYGAKMAKYAASQDRMRVKQRMIRLVF
jgi:hypothetical protein